MTTVSTYEEPYMGMNPLPGEFAGKTFGIYPRVSTKAQSRDNKTSQDAQIEFCQEYGEGFGMDLDPVCVRKESYSSTTGDRPELNQLLRDMKARGVRNLVIDRVDRMTRADPFGAYKLLDRIVRANIWIHVASAGFVIRDEDGFEKFLDMAKAARAANKARVSAKMRTVRYNAKHKNAYVKGNRPPYGYVFDAARRLVADRRPINGECPWEVRRHICLDYLAGISMIKISERLSLQHIPTSRELAGWENATPDWNASTIRDILKSALNCGGAVYSFRKKVHEEPPDEKHPDGWKRQVDVPREQQIPIVNLVVDPVITPEQHAAILARMAKGKKESPRNSDIMAEYAMLRGGMAMCGLPRLDDPTKICGGTLRVKHSWRTLTSMRYICRTHEIKPHKCAGTSVPYMELDLDVWTEVIATMEDEELLERLAEGQVAHDTADTPGSHLAEAKRRYADQDRKINNLTDTLEDIPTREGRAPILARIADHQELRQKADEEIAALKRLAANQAHRQELLANISYQMNVFENQIFILGENQLDRHENLRRDGSLDPALDTEHRDEVGLMRTLCQLLGVKVVVCGDRKHVTVEFNLGAATMQPWFPAEGGWFGFPASSDASKGGSS